MSANEDRARRLAEDFRAEHQLADRPLGDLFDFIHATVGCDVLALEAESAEHGLTMRDPDRGTVVIAVATTPHPMRQRSSLAHELGHVLAGDLLIRTPPQPGSRSPQEIRADAFARHLLLPLAAVRAKVRTSEAVTEQAVADLVHEFGLSPHLVAIQMKEAGRLSAHACAKYRTVSAGHLATRYGWAGHYRALQLASLQPRAPQSLMRRAVRAYERGLLGVAELAAWYGTDPDTIRAELGEPPPQPIREALPPTERPPLFPQGLPSRVES